MKYKTLIILSLPIIVASLYDLNYAKEYYRFINWEVIAVLSSLMIITTAIQNSGKLEKITIKLIKKYNIYSERKLFFFGSIVSMILAMFLTNDISLFIIVPFTLIFEKISSKNLKKLIVYETIGANIGSALTPIGNPQNIFIWHHYDVSFIKFTIKMLPFLLIESIILFFMILTHTKNYAFKEILYPKVVEKKWLFIISITILIIYIVLLEVITSKESRYLMLSIILIVYLLIDETVLKKCDWQIIIIFILLFIDTHILAEIGSSYIKTFFSQKDNKNTFLILGIISQFISNVPATFIAAPYIHNPFILSYGVNIGGNGSIISSFANLISIRLYQKKNFFISFQLISILYFLISIILFYILYPIWREFI